MNKSYNKPYNKPNKSNKPINKNKKRFNKPNFKSIDNYIDICEYDKK